MMSVHGVAQARVNLTTATAAVDLAGGQVTAPELIDAVRMPGTTPKHLGRGAGYRSSPSHPMRCDFDGTDRPWFRRSD